MLLNGKIVSENIKANLQKYFKSKKGKFVAIFLLGDDIPSKIYVGLKKKFGEDIGLDVLIFGNNLEFTNKLTFGEIKNDFSSIENIFKTIDWLNYNQDCLGIVVQLPLPNNLISYKELILSKITPEKDIDGLGGIMFGLSILGLIDFVPATAAGVMNILDYYDFGNVKSKIATVIGQSNLVGRPLALELIKRGAQVMSFNHYIDSISLQKACKMSDYIFSATGQIHLIDENYLKNDNSQIVIDIGWGIKNNKSCGDVDFEKVVNLVKAITPVPGGVGPVTVASLFNNILVIEQQKELIKSGISLFCKN